MHSPTANGTVIATSGVTGLSGAKMTTLFITWLVVVSIAHSPPSNGQGEVIDTLVRIFTTSPGEAHDKSGFSKVATTVFISIHVHIEVEEHGKAKRLPQGKVVATNRILPRFVGEENDISKDVSDDESLLVCKSTRDTTAIVVGSNVGKLDIRDEGVRLGDATGVTVGVLLGLALGITLGAVDGIKLGHSVGIPVGIVLG